MSEWISIEKKKPTKEKDRKEYSVNVLVTDGLRVNIGYYIFDHNIFEVCECVNKDLDKEATHWMPLPKVTEKCLEEILELRERFR